MKTTVTKLASEKQVRFINTLIGRSEPFTPRLYKDGKYIEAVTHEEGEAAIGQFETWRKYVVDAAKGLPSNMASKIIGLYISINDTIRSVGYVPNEVFDELDLEEFKLFKDCGIMTREQFDKANNQ